jgi:hypothetical protein
MKYHPFSEIFPMMGEDELKELSDSIKENGLTDAIVVLDDMILDGRNRFAACKLAGVPPKFIEFDSKKNALDFVIAKNLKRRHLTSPQRALAAYRYKLELDKAFGKRAPKKWAGGKRGGHNALAASSLFSVGVGQVDQLSLLHRRAPELFKEIQAGKLTVGRAFKAYGGRIIPPPSNDGEFVPPRNLYAASDMDAWAMVHKMCACLRPDKCWSFEMRVHKGMYNAHFWGQRGIAPLDKWPTLSGQATLRAAVAAALATANATTKQEEKK